MMKNAFLFAALVVGFATASCSGTRSFMSSLPPLSSNGSSTMAGGSGMSADRLAQSIGVVSGSWATTATQAVALKGLSKTTMLTSGIPSTVQLHVVVGLAMTNRAGAENLVRRQNTPGDADFHKYLTPAQFTAQFNPPASEAQAVATYLTKEGFTNVTVEPNNLMVDGYATATAAANAFHTTIQGTTVNGALVYANTTAAEVPAQFHGQVLAVLGLTNAYKMQSHLVKTTVARVAAPTTGSATVDQPVTGITKAANTPPPCLAVTAPNNVCTGGEYGPTQYQVAYDIPPKPTKACPEACEGGATSVAVMAEGMSGGANTIVLSDLRTAETYWGIDQVPYTAEKVGVSSPDTSGQDEWDLDTQISTGMAGDVKHLYVYYTTSLTDSDTALEFSHWVTDDLAQAGNASFGEPETLAYTDGSMLVDDEEFNEGAAQGQTMFASTGDNGEGCPVIAATGAPNTGVPEVCYPAASPYVMAVGGTTLDTNAVGATGPAVDAGEPGSYYGEHVWIATGGGVSKWETAPYWQSNGICGAACEAGRSIADIAMCADNNGCPMDVFVSGAQEGVGGTSLSSPMSMGIWARLETHWSNSLGFAPPVYYGVYGYYEPCPLGSTACTPVGAGANQEPQDDTSALPPDTTAPIGGFHDILIGSNGIPSSAAPGWDTPTGLGSVDYCVMQTDIEKSIFSGH